MKKSTITCDMEGRILTMNDGAEQVFGYPKEELIGKKRVSIFSPGEIVLQNVEGWLDEAVKKGEYIGKTYFIKKNKEKFDRVLIDAPCSGFGVIRRNPDSKWKLNRKDFNRILNNQINILNNYSKLVSDNGIMVYVTCSIFPSENEKQIALFLNNEFGKNFKIIEEKKISPHDSGYDGFYLAKLKKKC